MQMILGLCPRSVGSMHACTFLWISRLREIEWWIRLHLLCLQHGFSSSWDWSLDRRYPIAVCVNIGEFGYCGVSPSENGNRMALKYMVEFNDHGVTPEIGKTGWRVKQRAAESSVS